MATEKQLRTAGQELITLINPFETVIGEKIYTKITDESTADDILKIIKECIPLLEPADKFTKPTQAIIDTVTKKGTIEVDEPVSKTPVDFVPEPIDETTKEVSLTDEITNAERLKDLKDIALSEPKFKSIRGILSSFKDVSQLKETMLNVLNGIATKKHPEEEVAKEEPINAQEEQKEVISDTLTEKPISDKGYMSTTLIHTRKPFNNLFDISDVVRASIIASMEKTGFDKAHPIILWNDVVIDGHTRLEVANLLSIEEVPVLQKEFTTEQEALEYAIHNQRDRRNLSEAELLRCIAAVDKPMTKEEAGAKGGASNFKTKTAKKPTHIETAKKVNVGQSKVSDARTVLTDENAIEEVRTGKKTIAAAAKEIREKKSKKEKIVKIKVGKLTFLSAENWLKEEYFDSESGDWVRYDIYEVMEEYAVYYHKNIK
jgi:hypothetical protein